MSGIVYHETWKGNCQHQDYGYCLPCMYIKSGINDMWYNIMNCEYYSINKEIYKT